MLDFSRIPSGDNTPPAPGDFSFALSLRDGALHEALASIDGPVWRHLEATVPESRAWLTGQSGVEPLAVKALLADETRPHYATMETGFVLIARGINVNPNADPEDMVSLRMWCDDERLITVALRPVKAVEEVRAAAQATIHTGASVKTGQLVVGLIERLTLRIRNTARTLEQDVDELEDSLLDTNDGDFRASLKSIRRRTIWIKRFAEPQGDALLDAIANAPGWVTKGQLSHLRQLADASLRNVESLEAVRQHSILLQDHFSNESEESTKRMTYLLTLIASIFLPLNLVAGLLGANVGGIPLAGSPWGFVILCGIVVLLGLAGWLAYLRFR